MSSTKLLLLRLLMIKQSWPVLVYIPSNNSEAYKSKISSTDRFQLIYKPTLLRLHQLHGLPSRGYFPDCFFNSISYIKLPDENILKYVYPISDKNGSKAIPFGTSHSSGRTLAILSNFGCFILFVLFHFYCRDTFPL